MSIFQGVNGGGLNVTSPAYTKQQCEATPSGHVVVKTKDGGPPSSGTTCVRCGVQVSGTYTVVDALEKVPDEARVAETRQREREQQARDAEARQIGDAAMRAYGRGERVTINGVKYQEPPR